MLRPALTQRGRVSSAQVGPAVIGFHQPPSDSSSGQSGSGDTGAETTWCGASRPVTRVTPHEHWIRDSHSTSDAQRDTGNGLSAYLLFCKSLANKLPTKCKTFSKALCFGGQVARSGISSLTDTPVGTSNPNETCSRAADVRSWTRDAGSPDHCRQTESELGSVQNGSCSSASTVAPDMTGSERGNE